MCCLAHSSLGGSACARTRCGITTTGSRYCGMHCLGLCRQWCIHAGMGTCTMICVVKCWTCAQLTCVWCCDQVPVEISSCLRTATRQNGDDLNSAFADTNLPSASRRRKRSLRTMIWRFYSSSRRSGGGTVSVAPSSSPTAALTAPTSSAVQRLRHTSDSMIRTAQITGGSC